MTVKRKQNGVAPGKQFVAGLLLAVFAFVLAMASSSALHRAVHADAGKPNHECAATMLATGHVDASPVQIDVVIPPSFVSDLPSLKTSPRHAVDYFLLPGRGPPAFPS